MSVVIRSGMTPHPRPIPRRHRRAIPKALFDAIRDSVRAGTDIQSLAASQAFRIGLDWLDTGYCWEAHEVLEPVWMACPDGAAPNAPWSRPLIQIANARLKTGD